MSRRNRSAENKFRNWFVESGHQGQRGMKSELATHLAHRITPPIRPRMSPKGESAVLDESCCRETSAGWEENVFHM
jgi:hypothetical protein